jgi:hypothetical protein
VLSALNALPGTAPRAPIDLAPWLILAALIAAFAEFYRVR